MLNSDNRLKINTKLFIGCVLVSLGSAHVIKETYSFHDLFLLCSLLSSIILYIFLSGSNLKLRKKIPFPHLLMPFILLTMLGYFYSVFGVIDLSALLFHIQAGVGQLEEGIIAYYLSQLNTFLQAVVAFIIGSVLLIGQNVRYRRADFALSWVFYGVALSWFLFQNPIFLDETAVNLLEKYSIPKEIPQHEARKKNFIHVFLESAERTYMRSELFGDVMEPLEGLIGRGFEASNMAQIRDTGWSVAGMVAANCGVPLSPVGLIFGNGFDKSSSFLPSAVCLGDFLGVAEYDLTYLVGTDAQFAGIDTLYKTHGFGSVLDLDYFSRKYKNSPQLEMNRKDWGVSDGMVFEEALEVLKDKAGKGGRFGLTIETIGGHSPNGFLSPRCEQMEEIMRLPVDVLRAVKCTNWLLAEFINKSEKLGLLENTVVVVQSDHLAMKNKVYAELESGTRRNLFFVFGDGIQAQQSAKAASPVDVYPTLLEALGFKLKASRAGLGVSLFSDKSSLIEAYGEDEFNEGIRSNYSLIKFLWSERH